MSDQDEARPVPLTFEFLQERDLLEKALLMKGYLIARKDATGIKITSDDPNPCALEFPDGIGKDAGGSHHMWDESLLLTLDDLRELGFR